eukprot:2081038-Pyramimonas_sp.AAC.1
MARARAQHADRAAFLCLAADCRRDLNNNGHRPAAVNSHGIAERRTRGIVRCFEARGPHGLPRHRAEERDGRCKGDAMR